MQFPLGRAPLVMIFLFLFAAPFIFLRPAKPPGMIDFWVFAETHYQEYQERVKEFEKTHPGVQVRLQLIQGSVLRDKLIAAFLSETAAPDLAEIEIGDVGRFFQGKTSDIGFEDLTDRLKSEGWMEKLPQSRLAPYTNRGRIYGIPHDIHPVVLLYRDDLFHESGIDLPKEVQTWDDYFKVLERPGVLDSRRDGNRDRHGIMLMGTDWGHFRMLLVQRGGDFFDANGNVTLDSPIAIDTLQWYVDKFKKPHEVFMQPPTWGPDMFGPMKEDRLLAVLAPDWFIGVVKKNCPELAGKWRAMPLPAWEPGGRRTSTWGGTMIGMTRFSHRPDMTWELLKFLYFDKDALANRYDKTRILPPLKDSWSAPIFSEPDPYAGGQELGKLLVGLTKSVPSIHQGKYLSEAVSFVGPAITTCVMPPFKDPGEALHEAAESVREKQRRDRFAN